MSTQYGYGEIKLFAGSGSLELAQEISEYIKVPLEDYDKVIFPNENIFMRLPGSVRGQDVYLVPTLHKRFR